MMMIYKCTQRKIVLSFLFSSYCTWRQIWEIRDDEKKKKKEQNEWEISIRIRKYNKNTHQKKASFIATEYNANEQLHQSTKAALC